jgi:ferrous iron transport protein B
MSPAEPLRIALLGNPNCGKTAIFNLLTGSRQKVANYAGVTVERKEGVLRTPSGRVYAVLDLPGVYSLRPLSADEAVTRDILTGRHPDEPRPDLIVCIADATHLRLNLRLVLEARSLGVPMLLVLNMMDLARAQGITIDREALERELGIPVVETIGVARDGAAELVGWLDRWPGPARPQGAHPPLPLHSPTAKQDVDGQAEDELRRAMDLQAEVRRILNAAVVEPEQRPSRDEAIDRFVLHPVFGPVLLLLILFLVFQAVFSWAALPMDAIKQGVEAVAGVVQGALPEGPLRSLLTDGVIAGAGSVLVFLPQILILFFFILLLEDSGYLPRAAFLLDRPMAAVGLSGRSFIPLLSSFACAVPGIMATRTITDARDRFVTIMIAPLMTCSARLPVYALLIGAFIPSRKLAGWLDLQGLVLFLLYLGGIASAMAVAWVLKRPQGHAVGAGTLMMELPAYRWPSLRQLGYGLYERARIFIRSVGGIILALMVLLWALSSYPAAPMGAEQPAIYYSFAGRIGRGLAELLAPIGFNWQISIALVPGLAAREVAVGALGTVYALSAQDAGTAVSLGPIIASQWSLATGLSLLVWYVFAPQCVSTLVTVRRELGRWRPALTMAGYLFALAYAASFVTYHLAKVWGG